MEPNGVKVTSINGTVRVYANARSFDTDGYGDYVIFDEDGNKVATRRRQSVEEIEVTYAEE